MTTSINVPHKQVVEWLSDIDNASKNQDSDLLKIWGDFRNALNDPPSSEKALWRELVKGNTNKEQTINAFVTEWIAPSAGKERQTQLAAIRFLGRVGYDLEYSETVFSKLWKLATKGSCADIKAWALYSMHHCNLRVDSIHWMKTFGEGKCDEPGNCEWLQSMRDDQVRFWAVYAIGDMVKESVDEIARRGNGNGVAPRESVYCRLDRSLLPGVEKLILNHWPREIDVDVRAQLVNALAWSAGWGTIIKDENGKWRVPIMLKSAAESNYSRAPSPVPWAIRQIATNILHNTSLDPSTKLDAVEKLLGLASELISNCPEPTDREIAYVPDRYNQQRQYLLSIRNVAREALSDQLPQSADVVTRCAEHLLDVADPKSDSVNTTPAKEFRLRWLALIYLNDLAIGDKAEGVPGAGEVLLESANPRYKLMLGDQDQEIIRTVVANMVILMGEVEAAKYFSGVILDPESKDVNAAVDHHYDRYESKDGHDSTGAREILETNIRRDAARALGTIYKNDIAHNALVDALQSETIVVSSRARDALLAMGGPKAVNSMVQHSLQRMVEDRFFQPMEKTRKKGQKILDQIKEWSNSNYQYAYKAAVASFAVGIGLLCIGVLYALNPDADQTNIQWIFGSATLATLAGIVGTFLWEPAKGLQKVQSELTQVLMSFENYLGRMSLIGLGFAHAYTKERFDQLEFIRGISALSGKAMRESAAGLVDIGEWPNYKHVFEEPYTEVPSLSGKTVDEARPLVEKAELRLEEGELEYHKDRTDNTIISQKPQAGIYIAKGESIQVTVYKMTDPPKFAMPDFKYKTILEALDLAREKRLIVTKLEFVFNDNMDEGRVVEQVPPTTEKVVDGTGVTLTVCKKTGPTGSTSGDAKDSVVAGANETATANGSKIGQPSGS